MAKIRMNFPDICDYNEWCRLCDIMDALPLDQINAINHGKDWTSDKSLPPREDRLRAALIEVGAYEPPTPIPPTDAGAIEYEEAIAGCEIMDNLNG